MILNRVVDYLRVFRATLPCAHVRHGVGASVHVKLIPEPEIHVKHYTHGFIQWMGMVLTV